jgi:hypothetical protein
MHLYTISVPNIKNCSVSNGFDFDAKWVWNGEICCVLFIIICSNEKVLIKYGLLIEIFNNITNKTHVAAFIYYFSS